MSRDLESTGFVIERILEPQPTEDFKNVDPEGYERHMKRPLFLVFRARKQQWTRVRSNFSRLRK